MSTDLAAIAAFIQARLAEWEAAAKTAQLVRAEEWYEIAQQAVACTDTIEIGFAYQHIVLHDPASALREVTAIRTHLRAWEAIAVDFTRIDETEREFGAREALEGVLQADAAIWDDNADYDERWRP